MENVITLPCIHSLEAAQHSNLLDAEKLQLHNCESRSDGSFAAAFWFMIFLRARICLHLNTTVLINFMNNEHSLNSSLNRNENLSIYSFRMVKICAQQFKFCGYLWLRVTLNAGISWSWLAFRFNAFNAITLKPFSLCCQAKEGNSGLMINWRRNKMTKWWICQTKCSWKACSK